MKEQEEMKGQEVKEEVQMSLHFPIRKDLVSRCHNNNA